ncbi:radical SAM family heme chaperone HemW [Parvularcula lutaonensis]|uniref:Heme chaperone HemW n=1 Tax=Parvularcula lutaonensis TaxID=491923 RepID=A0ABV7MAE2_9PROT|nr:radical SAM family heme chaperone HemW [Parvularcula lutaonensis]GGY37444.1 coproporphyrinogen III oxidase [Parvularcula lutaonensis]
MRPLGLYVHWPYCARICPYCDFTVAKARAVDASGWSRVLMEDLRRLAAMTERRALTSVYFGGGTPSLMPLSVAGAVLEEAERLFGFTDGIELTVEANPDDLSLLEGLAGAGFNRLSLGVQSFDGGELEFLGRIHDGREARAAADTALRLFQRVSLDFIYALPEQSLGDWEKALREAVEVGAGHLSLYQLTIEPDTAFGKAAERGKLVPVTDDRSADFYELTQDVTADLGLPAYEVSNHARAGEEAVHNALYWCDAEWLAIGPGAHGRLGSPEARLATEGMKRISQYTSLTDGERISISSLSLAEHRLEVLSGGLRPVKGLDLARLGSDAEGVLSRAKPLIEQGFLSLGGGYLAASQAGRPLIDQLALLLSEGLADPAPEA